MNTGRWMRRAKCATVLLLLLLLTTGCWDRIEIEQRAVILAMSVDKAKPGFEAQMNPTTYPPGSNPAPEMTGYRVTVQIALPGKIPLGPGEGGATGGPEETVWVIGGSGHTINDAITNLQQQVAYQFFFGHLRVVIISEEVARNGLDDLDDYLTRNPEVRRTKWLSVTKNKAEDILRLQPPIGRVPTSFLVNTFDNAVKMGKFPENYAGVFWSHSSKRGQEGFLPMLELKEDNNVEISGIALFKNKRMVESMDATAIGHYMGILGMNPGGIRSVFPYNGTTFTIRSTYRSSKIKLKIVDGLPKFDVHMYVEYNLEEKTNEKYVVKDQAFLDKIMDAYSESVTKEIELGIKKTQQAGTDIYGFGEIVRARKPGYWNRHIRTKEKWQMMYKDIQVDVHVKGDIRRVGMKMESPIK